MQQQMRSLKMKKLNQMILPYIFAGLGALSLHSCATSKNAATTKQDLENKLQTLEVGQAPTKPGVYVVKPVDTTATRDTYVVSAKDIATKNVDAFFEKTKLPKKSAIGGTKLVGVEFKKDGSIDIYRERIAVDKTEGDLRAYVNDDAAYCDSTIMGLVIKKTLYEQVIDSLKNGAVTNESKKNKLKEPIAKKGFGLGPVISYFTNDMYGLGLRASVGNFGVEGEYFLNAPSSQESLGQTKNPMGRKSLSPSGKISSQEYVTTTKNNEEMPLFSTAATYSLPLNKKKNFFATVAAGPFFEKLSENTQKEYEIRFNSVESGDFLGRQPSDRSNELETSSTVKYGGIDASAGLTYQLKNKNRVGLRAGAYDIMKGFNTGNVTFTYEF